MSGNKEIKEARLNIRIEPSLKKKLQLAASKEKRTLANFVTSVLQEHLEKDDNENTSLSH